jgi:hypothetical protein
LTCSEFIFMYHLYTLFKKYAKGEWEKEEKKMNKRGEGLMEKGSFFRLPSSENRLRHKVVGYFEYQQEKEAQNLMFTILYCFMRR